MTLAEQIAAIEMRTVTVTFEAYGYIHKERIEIEAHMWGTLTDNQILRCLRELGIDTLEVRIINAA